MGMSGIGACPRHFHLPVVVISLYHLSASRITSSCSSLSSFSTVLWSLVKLFLDTFTCFRIPHTHFCRSSASCSENLLTPSFTAAIVSVRQSLEGAAAKFNPSFDKSRMAGTSVWSVSLRCSSHTSYCLDRWLISISCFSSCVCLVMLWASLLLISFWWSGVKSSVHSLP